MSQPFYKNKSFLELQKKWRKKLEKSGFEDIETSEEHVSRGSWDFYKGGDAVKYSDYTVRAEYYYMANHFLNEYQFETRLDKIIWEYHAEGISITNISKLLKKVRKKVSRDQVWVVIKKLRKEMFSRYRSSNE